MAIRRGSRSSTAVRRCRDSLSMATRPCKGSRKRVRRSLSTAGHSHNPRLARNRKPNLRGAASRTRGIGNRHKIDDRWRALLTARHACRNNARQWRAI